MMYEDSHDCAGIEEELANCRYERDQIRKACKTALEHISRAYEGCHIIGCTICDPYPTSDQFGRKLRHINAAVTELRKAPGIK